MRLLLALISILVILQISTGAKEQIDVSFTTTKATKCSPFGVRLSWGRSVVNPSSHQKLSIRFNTLQKCQNLDLLLNDAYIIHCPIHQISVFPMSLGDNFTSFVHKCSLTSQIKYDHSFNYNIIDQYTQATYFSKDIAVKIKNPNDVTRPVQFIHFADWGKLKQTASQRPQITDVVLEMAQKQEIDAIIINGDISYDFNTSPEHHLEFMSMLEKISRKISIIFNRGNHQYKSASQMFCQYFQVYDLCKRNATALSIGSAYLSLFDPQATLIPRKFHLYTTAERLSSRINLAHDLDHGSKSGRTMIAFSHYPLVCSYPSSSHCIPNENYNQFLPLYLNLQEHYNTLLDYKVPLILSGHVHTYQRTHKIIRGYKYSPITSNKSIVYNTTEDPFFIQVIDGVAGSDNDLYGDYTYKGVKHQVKPFLAAYNLHTIGFGVLKVSPFRIGYQHFGVNINGTVELIDNFDIELPRKPSDDSPELSNYDL